MFETILVSGGSGRRRLGKGVTLSISLVLHAAVIAAVIVVPLLHAESRLPGFAVINAALIAPPILPGVPPGRPGKPGNGPGGPTKGPKDPPPVSGTHRFLAPVDVPTEIIDEDPGDFVQEEWGGSGVDGGSGDGKAPWVIGEEIKPDVFDVNAVAITTIRPPRLIKRVSPNYPPAALAARISGAVVIMAVTDIYGRVRELHVENGNALLSPAALEAVRGWIYEPYLVNGIPKPVSFKVTVTFTLEKR